MRTRMMSDDYIKYERAGRKWYQPILIIYRYKVRISRLKFKRASEAIDYRRRFVARLGQARAAAFIKNAVEE